MAPFCGLLTALALGFLWADLRVISFVCSSACLGSSCRWASLFRPVLCPNGWKAFRTFSFLGQSRVTLTRAPTFHAQVHCSWSAAYWQALLDMLNLLHCLGELFYLVFNNKLIFSDPKIEYNMNFETFIKHGWGFNIILKEFNHYKSLN